MFAAGEDFFVPDAGEEVAGVVDDAAGLVGNGASAEDRGGFAEGEVEDGREDGVEAEGAGFAGDEPAVLTIEGALAGGEDGGRGRHGGDEVAEAVDEAAFEVDRAEERRGAGVVGFAEERGDLRGLLDVAAKENDAAGADAAEPGALFDGEGGASDAGDEDLASLFGELHVATAGHEDAGLAAAVRARSFGGGDGVLTAPCAHGRIPISLR